MFVLDPLRIKLRFTDSESVVLSLYDGSMNIFEAGQIRTDTRFHVQHFQCCGRTVLPSAPELPPVRIELTSLRYEHNVLTIEPWRLELLSGLAQYSDRETNYSITFKPGPNNQYNHSFK